MRSKNAAKNLITFLIYEVFVFALGIVFPRFIILTYGSEVNGLISTITRLLSLINLIQAGAVGAAIYQMYKPVADNDFETQSAILYSSRNYYKRISVIFLGIAFIVSIIYAFILKNGNLSFIEIVTAFFVLAVNGALALRINSICDIFLSSHQKKYYLTISSIANQIIHYSFLSIVLIFKLHFLFINIAILLGGVVSYLLNIFFYLKLSKGKITRNPTNKQYYIPDKKYLMFSSIGTEAVSASPQVIISTVFGLASSSVFSVYSLIFISMKTIINSIQLSVSAIFGNLVKTSSDEHIAFVFDIIALITIGLGTILVSCLSFLIIPFIQLYTRGITDIEYLHYSLCVFVVFFTIVFSFRTSFGYVATVYGLFKKTCFITLFSGGSGIVISIVSGILWGMPYVMVGLICDLLASSIATIVVMKNNISWFTVRRVVIRTIVMAFFSVVGFSLYRLVSPTMENWIQWIVWGCIVGATSSVFFIVYCIMFERKQTKYLVQYVKRILSKKGD